MSRTALAAVAVLALAGSTTHGGIIVAYESLNLNTLPPDPDSVGSGVTGENLLRGTGLDQATDGLSPSTFASDSFSGVTSKAAAIDASDVLTWGFTSSTAFDLTTLDIGYDRSGSGPTSIAIDVAVNESGLYQEVHFDDAVDVLGELNAGIDLSAFTNVTSATFRLSGWNATSANGLFDPENLVNAGGMDYAIVVNGDPAAVPEPGSLILMLTTLIGGLAGGVRSRLRRLAA